MAGFMRNLEGTSLIMSLKRASLAILRRIKLSRISLSRLISGGKWSWKSLNMLIFVKLLQISF